jgi:hypothetical protein
MSRLTHKALADVIYQLVDITPSIAPSSDCLGNPGAVQSLARSRAEAESPRAGCWLAGRAGLFEARPGQRKFRRTTEALKSVFGRADV